MPTNPEQLDRLRSKEQALLRVGFDSSAAKLAVYGTDQATDEVLTAAAPASSVGTPKLLADRAPLEAQTNYFEDQETVEGRPTARQQIAAFLKNKTPDIHVRYDKGDQLRRELVDYSAIAEGERALRERDMLADFTIATNTVTPIVLGLQQAWYGALRGEHPAEFAQRLFPEVTIPDSAGQQKKKWQALVGLDLMRLRLVGLGTPFHPLSSDATTEVARDLSLRLAEEAGEDLLEFRDVFEAGQSGYGIDVLPGAMGAKSLPDKGTPERTAAEAGIADTGADIYRNWSSHGPAGTAAMAGAASIFATMEIANDPMLATVPMAPGVVNLLRRSMPASSVARVTGAIAVRTKGFEDVLRAVEDGTKWVAKAERTYQTTKRANDGVRLLQARKQLAKSMALLEAAKDPGASEAVLLHVVPREAAEAVKDKVYTGTVVSTSEGAFASGEQRQKAILANIQDTIRTKMRDGSPASEVAELDARYQQLAAMKPKDIPLNLSAAGTPAEDINAVINAERRAALSGESTHPIIDLEDPAYDAAGLQQRILMGPDDAEQSGEAFRLLAAGADIDDVAVREMSIPAYMSGYGLRPHNLTADGLLDVPQLTKANRQAATRLEKARVKRIVELDELDKTRPLTDSEGMELLEHKTTKYKFEDKWLPHRTMHTDVERASWQQTIGEKLGDVFTPGLYPESLSLRPPAMLRSLLYQFREPMRVMKSMHPEMFARIRNGTYAAEFEMKRMAEFFDQELVRAGVKNKAGSAGKMVSKERGEQLFDLLDADPRSEAFTALHLAADDDMRMSMRRIRGMFDYMADKQGISPSERYITGYINHVLSAEQLANGSIPLDLIGASPRAKTFAAHLLDRTGKGAYERDPLLALDIYSRAASRKLHIEPMLKDMQFAAKKFVKENPADAWFMNYTNDLINNFKGTPSMLGNSADSMMRDINISLRKSPEFTGAWKQVMGDKPIPVYDPGDAGRTVMAMTSLAYSGALTGNARYFPMAVATGIATNAPRFGVFRTLKSLFTWATPEGQALARAAGIGDQWNQIFEAPSWKSISQQAASVHAGGPSIAASENFIRSVTFNSAKEDYMKRLGLSTWREVQNAGLENRILVEASRAAEEVNHLFGQLGKPPKFARVSKSGSVAATQFLSFIPKQLEELASQTMRNPGNIISYLAMSGYISRVAAQDLGIDMSSYVGFGFAPKRAEDLTSISMDLMKAMENWNMVSSERLMGTGNPDEVATAHANLMKALETFMPLAAMVRQNIARGTEPFTGERRGPGGELVRELDLNWLNSHKGERGDLLSVATQLRGVNDKLESQRMEANRRVTETKAILLRRLAFEYHQAVADGDVRGMDAAHQAFISNGIPVPDVSGIVEHEAMSMVIDRETRDMLKNFGSVTAVMDETARLNAARSAGSR